MLPFAIAGVCFLWLQAWNTTGDSYSIHPGDKPWISEMYGYSYACAAADVWHKVDFSAMLYPAYFSASKYGMASSPFLTLCLRHLLLLDLTAAATCLLTSVALSLHSLVIMSHCTLTV